MLDIQKRQTIIDAMAGRKHLEEGCRISCSICVASMEVQKDGYESFRKTIKLTDDEMKIVAEALISKTKIE